MKIKNLFKKTEKTATSKIVAMDKTQLSQVVGGASTDVVTSSIEADRVSGAAKDMLLATPETA